MKMNLNEAAQILNKSGYLLKESEIPEISYRVLSATVDVYEDDYKEGKGKHYTKYSLDIVNQEFKYVYEFLIKLNEELYSTDNPIVFSGETKDGILDIQGTLIVDENRVPADDFEIEQWKKGEKKLYYSLIKVKIRCCELTPIRGDRIENLVHNANVLYREYKIEF